MNWLIKKWKRLRCKHEEGFFRRNIYGDEINYANARSVYQCADCGKYIYKQELNQSEESKSIDFLNSVCTLPVSTQHFLIEQAGLSSKIIAEHWKVNSEKKYKL